MRRYGLDHTIDGIRYIQAPVSYPNEWKQRPGSLTVGPDTRGAEFNLSPQARQLDAPLCIWDVRRVDEAAAGDAEVAGSNHGGAGGVGGFGFVGEMSARWSDHYKENPREPENTELMWWVKGAMRGAK